MNINKNFNDVTIFNDKKLILLGPLTDNVDKLNLETYDYVFTIGFYTSHLKQLIEYKKKFNFSICRVLGGYGKESQEEYVLPYDNHIDYYFLPEIHTINEYIKENIIDKKKLFSMNNNYKSFGWTTEGKYPTGFPKLLLFFHVNNIIPKELFIVGFTIYMMISKNDLVYEESYWINTFKNIEESKLFKSKNNKDDHYHLIVIKNAIDNNTMSLMEQQQYYLDNCWKTSPHCYKLDYNFFLKYLSMYNSFVKLDKKLKKIVKKYNKLFDI